mmetsp:Transcript_88417/g.245472  ORF Transcript_88417/g.245472 Transcript_88417/m.245472 type:complete len:463 (+) Transcript_88417:72-1460(+)
MDPTFACLGPTPALGAASPALSEHPLQRRVRLHHCRCDVGPGVLALSSSQGWWPRATGAAVTACVAAGLAAARRRTGRSRRLSRATVARLAADAASADEGSSQDFGITPFPFSAVVGQKDMKLALLLNLVDPAIGGVMIQGDRGTGKSTAVRALVRLLPEIPCAAGDKYNSDPTDPSAMSDEVRDRIAAGEDVPVVMRRTPFVELPLGATEDRVTGTIDIERALLEGGKAFEPGILARVNRGILYIDEVNLLDDQLVDVLLDSAAGGWNTVEREGVSVRHPARFVLIGTAHPDEGDLRPQLLDRFGMTVGIRTPNDAESRLQVLMRTAEWARNPAKIEERFAAEDATTKAKILEARSRLRSVTMATELKVKISTLCSKLNVDGLRGDIVTNRAARALAALAGRTEVTEEDVLRIAASCLQHRLRQNVVMDNVDNGIRVAEVLTRVFGKGPPVQEPMVADMAA